MCIRDSYTILATQNPVEQEGTYKLPEAQLDRFLMKITMGYPSLEEEVDVYKRQRLRCGRWRPWGGIPTSGA